jgi:hypothetical protein
MSTPALDCPVEAKAAAAASVTRPTSISIVVRYLHKMLQHEHNLNASNPKDFFTSVARGGRLWEQPNSGCSRCNRTCDV